MADTTRLDRAVHRPRWKIVGPGLVVAATGVGAGDLVATLIAGEVRLHPAVGRRHRLRHEDLARRGRRPIHLATGRTIFEGWRTLGHWTTVVLRPYIVIWGFVYGAAAMSGTGLAL